MSCTRRTIVPVRPVVESRTLGQGGARKRRDEEEEDKERRRRRERREINRMDEGKSEI